VVIGGAGQRQVALRDGVRYLSEADSLFAAWMQQLDCSAVVVRPDRYVFGAARDAAQLNRLVAAVGRHVLAA
jgi:3-(3-hydroxy-phenyl)propionate hydroxylase